MLGERVNLGPDPVILHQGNQSCHFTGCSRISYFLSWKVQPPVFLLFEDQLIWWLNVQINHPDEAGYRLLQTFGHVRLHLLVPK